MLSSCLLKGNYGKFLMSFMNVLWQYCSRWDQLIRGLYLLISINKLCKQTIFVICPLKKKKKKKKKITIIDLWDEQTKRLINSKWTTLLGEKFSIKNFIKNSLSFMIIMFSTLSNVFGYPKKNLFLILKVLFLMKQVKHHSGFIYYTEFKSSSVTLTLRCFSSVLKIKTLRTIVDYTIRRHQ